jgi:phosphohistidine phosphatase
MPRRIYFVRHGRADRENFQGDDDTLRPLTGEGAARMAGTARTLAGLALGVDVVLSSPLTRAKQTARILAEALAPPGGLLLEPRLGLGFTTRDLESMLREYRDWETLLMVGHEPSFSAVIGDVIGGGQVTVKKGSLLRVDLHGQRPPRGVLAWSLPPRLLVGD